MLEMSLQKAAFDAAKNKALGEEKMLQDHALAARYEQDLSISPLEKKITHTCRV